MAKKTFSKLITFAAMAGAAAAAVSYFVKYKSFRKELDEEFHEFEDEFEEFSDPERDSGTATRSYVSLNPERQTENSEEDAVTGTEEKPVTCCESLESTKEAEKKDDSVSAETAGEPKEAVQSFEKDTAFVTDSTTIVEDTTV